jgi:hypothetical protein
VNEREPAHSTRCHGDVGHLRSHADDKRVVREIEIIRLATAGEQELRLCRTLTAQHRVVAPGEVKRDSGVNQQQ